MASLSIHKLFTVVEGGHQILDKTSDHEQPDLDRVETIETINIVSNEFDRAVSRYYLQKSVESDPSLLPMLHAEEAFSEELAHKVLSIPVSEPRHVLIKLNILENELATDMDLTAPVEGRHLLMFAALKADMIALLAQLANKD